MSANDGVVQRGNDPERFFARNLGAQEARRWAEYLEMGTREALAAWRTVRVQMREARAA